MNEYTNQSMSVKCKVDTYDSLENRRTPAIELAQKLCEYDIISFDVFGTLILRPFTSPRVLFSIMESQLGIYKFSKIRVDAEEEIRQIKQSKYCHDNVTLAEIYNLIAQKTNLDAEQTAQLEYNLELKYCYANPYFKEIISICAECTKKIIVCTDMYLSRAQITGLLKKAGYPNLDCIYVSSELNKSKKQGDLFEKIREIYKNKKIIHVGDNFGVDIEKAKRFGIDTYYYKNVNDIGSKTRVEGMSYIAGRVYSAIINNHFYCNNEEYDEAYKLGYIYGGIYVLGFVQWVNKIATDFNIDKILFLSRDGDIYSKMYDLLPAHKQWEYFYWSRLAGMKITAMENFYEFCQRMIWHKARGVYNIKIVHLLNFLELGSLISYLENYNLSKDDVLSKTTAASVEKIFYDNKAYIIDSFKPDIEATINSIKKAVGNAKKVAIVDVGWAGTGPLIIRKVINHYLKLECKVYSLLAGYRQPIENMAALYTMNDSIYAYLFSTNLNRDLFNLHSNFGTKKNNLLLEIFTQSCTPSFLGYTDKGLEFDREETPNYETIRNITKGITDFVTDYVEKFQQDSFIMNISAYDAYLPFNELKNSSNRMNDILSNLIISRGKLYDAEDTSKETWFSFLYKDE